MAVVLKLQKGEDMRRFRVLDPDFRAVQELVASNYGEGVIMRYQDDDGDWCTLTDRTMIASRSLARPECRSG